LVDHCISEKSSPNIFYVYKYLRSKASKNGLAGSPYYIGKGRGKRASRKANHYVPVPTNAKNIAIVSEGMSELDALQLEMLLIHFYGRVDLGTGCLNNMTDGGDGITGADAVRLAMKYWRSLVEDKRVERRLAVKAWHESLTKKQKSQREEALRKSATEQWANSTEEQLRAWKEAWHLGRANMSEGLKCELAEKNGKFHKARIANLSPEEREERNARLHTALLGRWANTPKKPHCPKGHPFDEQNTYTNPSTGHRQCKICVRASKARHKVKRTTWFANCLEGIPKLAEVSSRQSTIWFPLVCTCAAPMLRYFRTSAVRVWI